jgi:transposase-like protein
VADGLACLAFPKAQWAKIRWMIPIERLNAQIKRRPEIVGIFLDEATITRASAQSCSNRFMNGLSTVPDKCRWKGSRTGAFNSSSTCQ